VASHSEIAGSIKEDVNKKLLLRPVAEKFFCLDIQPTVCRYALWLALPFPWFILVEAI
jgi:hypothetical protein